MWRDRMGWPRRRLWRRAGAAPGRRPRAAPRIATRKASLSPLCDILGHRAQDLEHHRRPGISGEAGRIEGRRDLDHIGADDMEPAQGPKQLLRLEGGKAA